MDLATRFDLISSVGEEVLTPEELRTLLETKKKFIAYDGFEPSGNPHIAQGIIRALNVNKMTKAGATFKMFVADWHAFANNKFGGDLEKIQLAGKYLIEVWKATGMDLDHVQFISAHTLVQDPEYWKKVMQVARHATVQRIIRCGQIMGRAEGDVTQSSQIFYPCMQAADIFHMEVDIAQLGMDQRKVNVLARELGPQLFGSKPVAVHHHMLMGLGQPPAGVTGIDRAIALKMSKSQPHTAIFMSDTTEQITDKLRKAYCPEGVVEENPVLDYYKHLIFEKFKKITIARDKKFGGDVTFGSYDEFSSAFAAKKVHPLDVKMTAARYIDEAVAPVRAHFAKNKKARELQEQVLGFTITR